MHHLPREIHVIRVSRHLLLLKSLPGFLTPPSPNFRSLRRCYLPDGDAKMAGQRQKKKKGVAWRLTKSTLQLRKPRPQCADKRPSDFERSSRGWVAFSWSCPLMGSDPLGISRAPSLKQTNSPAWVGLQCKRPPPPLPASFCCPAGLHSRPFVPSGFKCRRTCTFFNKAKTKEARPNMLIVGDLILDPVTSNSKSQPFASS